MPRSWDRIMANCIVPKLTSASLSFLRLSEIISVSVVCGVLVVFHVFRVFRLFRVVSWCLGVLVCFVCFVWVLSGRLSGLDVVRAHDGPVTSLDCHPLLRSRDARGDARAPDATTQASVSDLYLSSACDWTVKLWSAKVKA